MRSAMADRKRSSYIGLSRAAILLWRAIVGCTMTLLCALMVHPREHQDQDAPEEWGIWDAAKIIAAAAATGAMGIALLQISRRPWGTGAAPARATAVGGDAESLSPRHFGQLRVRAGRRLFASIAVATGGMARRFFARTAGACMKQCGAVWSCMERFKGACAASALAAAVGGAAWRFSARTAVAMGRMAWRFFARIAGAAATMRRAAGSLSTGHFWRCRARAGATGIVARTTRAATAAGAARADFLTGNTPGTDASDGSEGGGEGAGNSREGVGMGDFTHKSSPQQANFPTPRTTPSGSSKGAADG